jgi:PAS domain-containing protein
MTHRTPSRAQTAKAKSTSKKPARPVRRTESAALARIKARAIYERAMFGAAFKLADNSAFGNAAAQAIKVALGATDVALALSRGSDVAPDVVSTSLELQSVVTGIGRCPLGACLVSGHIGYNQSGTKRKPSARDKALVNAKIKGYCCVPVMGPTGKVIAAVLIGFNRIVKLENIAEQFDTDLSVPFAASIYSRRKEISGVAPNQFSSLAKAIPGVVYQRIVKMDGDIRYTFLSEGARDLFGVDPAEVIKNPDVLFRTYSEDYRQTFRSRLVEASKTLTKWDVEATIDLPDGRTRTTHAIARPEPLPDG